MTVFRTSRTANPWHPWTTTNVTQIETAAHSHITATATASQFSGTANPCHPQTMNGTQLRTAPGEAKMIRR
eukprot:12437526-Ditylum_brightwellii.AAC.1